MPTVSFCLQHGFNVTRMTSELDISTEHWNTFENLEEELFINDSWVYDLDKDSYLDLWTRSTYSISDMLVSVTYGALSSPMNSVLARKEFAFNGTVVSSGKKADILELKDKASFALGNCVVMKILDPIFSTSYFIILTRYVVHQNNNGKDYRSNVSLYSRMAPVSVVLAEDHTEEVGVPLDAWVRNVHTMNLQQNQNAYVDLSRHFW